MSLDCVCACSVLSEKYQIVHLTSALCGLAGLVLPRELKIHNN